MGVWPERASAAEWGVAEFMPVIVSGGRGAAGPSNGFRACLSFSVLVMANGEALHLSPQFSHA